MKELFVVAAIFIILLCHVSDKSKSLNPKSRQAAINPEPKTTMNIISKVPQTEEEVMQALQGSNEMATTALRGIARGRIGMGDTPEQAYEYALLQYISVVVEGENDKY